MINNILKKKQAKILYPLAFMLHYLYKHLYSRFLWFLFFFFLLSFILQEMKWESCPFLLLFFNQAKKENNYLLPAIICSLTTTSWGTSIHYWCQEANSAKIATSSFCLFSRSNPAQGFLDPLELKNIFILFHFLMEWRNDLASGSAFYTH